MSFRRIPGGESISGKSVFTSNGPRKNRALRRCRAAVVDVLEDRLMLSVTHSAVVAKATKSPPPIKTTFINMGKVKTKPGVKPLVSAAVSAPYTPAEMDAAYGVNQISFNGVTGNGAGETIAIVDAYNDPNIVADAQTFSAQFGLPAFNGSGEPTLNILSQTGSTIPNQTGTPSLPGNGSPGGWDVEESLDVEWAHAIAPDANIILFEANSSGLGDLLTAVQTAAKTTGVCDVSMSWGGGDFSGEQSYDSYFTTPSGHPGVTFLASSGDGGEAAGYPATSPNVVGVGGTNLTINSGNTYGGETAWSGSSEGSSGGASAYENIPSYQDTLNGVNGASTTKRNVPDVSMDADPNSGVYVLDTYYTSGYLQVGGTSLSCPMWAGLIAITDQDRSLLGLSSLDGVSQTLPELYSIYSNSSEYSADFHDITSGYNGVATTGTGYDLVTGIGSPIANKLIPVLADDAVPIVTTNPTSQAVLVGNTATFTAAATGTPTPTVQWYLEPSGSSSFSAISGATSTTLTVSNAMLSQSGNEYEAVFSNGVGTPATTTPATLTVESATTITTNPTSQTIPSGNNATFTAAASGSPAPTVQWYSEPAGSNTFSAVSGATSTSLVLNGVTLSQSGTEYEAVFTNAVSSATTSPALLTVTQAPAVLTNPRTQTVNAGTDVTFTAAASGGPTPTVQWYVEPYGSGTFSPISGATSTTLDIGNATGVEDQYQYEAVFSNGIGTPATTTPALLTVLGAPAITLNPQSSSVTAGQSIVFTSAARDEAAMSVQWYFKVPTGTQWVAIYGDTATSLTVGKVTTYASGNQYMAVFTSVYGSTSTAPATLTVDSAPTVATEPVSQSVAAGQNVSFTATATGTPTPTVQWELETPGSGAFSPISGATSTTLTLNSVTTGESGNLYEAVFSNGIGSPATTTPATLTVTVTPSSQTDSIVTTPAVTEVPVTGTQTDDSSTTSPTTSDGDDTDSTTQTDPASDSNSVVTAALSSTGS